MQEHPLLMIGAHNSLIRQWCTLRRSLWMALIDKITQVYAYARLTGHWS
jgi:hypothetical protein